MEKFYVYMVTSLTYLKYYYPYYFNGTEPVFSNIFYEFNIIRVYTIMYQNILSSKYMKIFSKNVLDL